MEFLNTSSLNWKVALLIINSVFKFYLIDIKSKTNFQIEQ